MWVRLLTYDHGNPRSCHEWITGKKRYLRKEHTRKDEMFSFNNTGSGTAPKKPEPFVFDLAAMLQGQRSKYNSTMVRSVLDQVSNLLLNLFLTNFAESLL